LNLYGHGSFRKGIERLIAESELEGRIRVRGHALISEIWAENHVLVQPSRMEGLPITIVEAMMSARPVVTTDVAGNAELLTNGKTGFVANAPTVASIAQALESMWASRADLQQMGERAAASVRDQISADPTGDFIKEVCGIAENLSDKVDLTA
jgi:glycosyltransferase involved in cell wall biosynthesis